MPCKDQVAHRDRTGIDEGSAGLSLFGLQLHDRIESRAGGLAADPSPAILAMLAKGKRQRENLGKALDREGLITVASPVYGSIDAHHGNAELSRVDMGKLRDIVRNLSLPKPRGQLVMDLVYNRLQIFHTPVL